MAMTNQNTNTEIHEALTAGARALNSLRKAQQHLKRARNWGYADILGGGLITSLLKHSSVSDAQSCVMQAQDDLRSFRRELADVEVPDLEFGEMLKFADLCFDGLFVDLAVQSRIESAGEQLELTCRKVEDILRRLREM